LLLDQKEDKRRTYTTLIAKKFKLGIVRFIIYEKEVLWKV